MIFNTKNVSKFKPTKFTKSEWQSIRGIEYKGFGIGKALNAYSKIHDSIKSKDFLDDFKTSKECKKAHEVLQALHEAFEKLKESLKIRHGRDDLMSDLIYKYYDELALKSKKSDLWNKYMDLNK